MNIPIWSYPLSPFNPTTTIPSSYYPYPYIQSPYNTGVMLNSSIQTSLNSSSGYESASNETSLIDPCYSSPSSIVKESPFNFIYQQSNLINDDNKIQFEDNQININEESDESMTMMMINQETYYGRKKRRVLSRPQRQEANRRERQRMETINEAYEQLRNALPFKKGRKRQKMSRMDTVDGAIRYIHSLLQILHGPNYNPNWAKS